MHGGSITREAIPRYTQALRNERFAYNGKLLGRNIPTPRPAHSTSQ